jgi:hypothetical protein
VNDPDNTNLQTASIRISNNYVNGEDMLTYNPVSGVSGTWSASTGTMTLTVPANITSFQTAIRNVLYSNTSDNPTTTTRTMSFTAGDGQLTSSPATRTIEITAANDVPVLGNIGLTALAYSENDPPTPITTTITVTDPDAGTTITGATIAFTNNYQNGQDVLSFTNANGISHNWLASTEH